MQSVLNGKSYRPSPSLSASTVWHLVEILENTHGWRRVSSTVTAVCLTKKG